MTEQQYFEAACRNDVPLLYKLIPHFHNRISQESQKSALHYALEAGSLDVLKILLPREALLFNELNYTPLMAAARAGNLQYARALVYNANNQLYASFDWLFKSEYAVQIALRGGFMKIAEYLCDIEREADVNRAFLYEVVYPGKIRVFDALYRTPLMYAACSASDLDIQAFEHYLGYQDLNGVTALMFAVLYRNYSAIAALLDKEAKIQAVCPFMELASGFTALMLAAALRCDRAIEMLVHYEQGMCDCDGKCAFDYYDGCTLLQAEAEVQRAYTRSLAELKDVLKCGAYAGASIENRCVGSPYLIQQLLTQFELQKLGDLLAQIRQRNLALKQHEKSSAILQSDDSKSGQYIDEINRQIAFLEPQLRESEHIVEKLYEYRDKHFPRATVDFYQQFRCQYEEKAVDCCNLLVETHDDCTFMPVAVIDVYCYTDVTSEFFARFTETAEVAKSFLNEKNRLLRDHGQSIRADMREQAALFEAALERVSAVAQLPVKEQIKLLYSGFEEDVSPNILVNAHQVCDVQQNIYELMERREELMRYNRGLNDYYYQLDYQIAKHVASGVLIFESAGKRGNKAIQDVSDASEY